MPFVPQSLKIVTEDGEKDTFDFVGRIISRSFGEQVGHNLYKKVIKIYQTEDRDFILHFYRRNEDGEIIRANYTNCKSLGLVEVRSALKEAGIYPGPEAFSEALFNSVGVLEKLD